MDRTEVMFSGRIKYDSREDNFTFYDDNRDPFGVTVDAGRDARERIETECDNPPVLWFPTPTFAQYLASARSK